MGSPYLQAAAARSAGAAESAPRASETEHHTESASRACGRASESATRASGCWHICVLPLSPDTAVDLMLSPRGDIVLAAAPASLARARALRRDAAQFFRLGTGDLNLIVARQTDSCILDLMAGHMSVPAAAFAARVAANLAARRASLRMLLPDGSWEIREV